MSILDEHATADPLRLALRRGNAIVFEETGLKHPRSTLLGGRCFTPYADVTHFGIGPLGMRLATRRGLFLFRRSAFSDPQGPDVAAAELMQRIRSGPNAAAHVEQLMTLERRAQNPPPARITRAVIALCLMGFLLQLLYGPPAELAGMFSAPLVSAGEWWRLVTANFLHGSIPHLLLNLLCLLILGLLIERSVGAAGAVFIVGVSAAGSMIGSWLADYAWALGASGIVAGLAGALLWLEFRTPEEVPAGWRIPRRSFVAALVLETALLGFVPGVAHAAHLGGFLAGGLVAPLVGPGPEPRPGRRWLVPTNAVLAFVLVLAVFGATRSVFVDDATVARRRAQALLAMQGISPLVLNNEAWRIAVAVEPSPEALDAALRLADRAAEETDRLDPNVLDTLAEVHFARGDALQAAATIEEAIALAPDVTYFQEQRRRFLGERPATDRPKPPGRLELPDPPGSREDPARPTPPSEALPSAGADAIPAAP